jgi:hypothetical protein
MQGKPCPWLFLLSEKMQGKPCPWLFLLSEKMLGKPCPWLFLAQTSLTRKAEACMKHVCFRTAEMKHVCFAWEQCSVKHFDIRV